MGRGGVPLGRVSEGTGLVGGVRNRRVQRAGRSSCALGVGRVASAGCLYWEPPPRVLVRAHASMLAVLSQSVVTRPSQTPRQL